MSAADLEAYLQRVALTPFTRYTLIEKPKIIAELKQIRDRGFAVDNEEMEAGVRCVAALISDHNAQPAASISITGAAMRLGGTYQ
jgi:DNA-binding IclR family transcriptional regulator